jgi:sugar phosphate isomerase/epimerase
MEIRDMRGELQTRRDFITGATALAAGATLAGVATAESKPKFRLKYIVGAAMYGTKPLAEILPEVRKTGAEAVEFWARPHGNQREQVDKLGVEAVRDLLKKNRVRMGSLTCFKYGIFGMQPEMKLVKSLGGDMVICNSVGPRGLKGDALKSAVKSLAEKLKPHVARAEELGVILGVENHGGTIINSPESQLMLMDLVPSSHLGMALAGYHMPQNPDLIGRHIQRLGKRLVHFQAWEHGMGCSKKLPKAQELMQLPGRGPLDFRPIVKALKAINFGGRVEIFMHPVPRGIPILETTAKVTAEINRSRAYLEKCLVQA